MEKNELEERIVQHCNDKDEFLLKLRLVKEFDDESYHTLKKWLISYGESLGDTLVISRKVIGCVFFLMQLLEETRINYVEISHKDTKKIETAYSELWHIIYEHLIT